MKSRRHHLPLPTASLLATAIAFSMLLAGCTTPVPDADQPVDVNEPSPDSPVESPGDTPVAPEAPIDPDLDWNDAATDDAREHARGLLGMNEGDLPGDVRIARRGDEYFMLTEDYVLGRRTVELDDDGSGFRVMTVTVELPEGPETFELQGG